MSSAYFKCLEKQKFGCCGGLCRSNKERKNTRLVWVGVAVTTMMSHSSVLSACGLVHTSIYQLCNKNQVKRNSNQVDQSFQPVCGLNHPDLEEFEVCVLANAAKPFSNCSTFPTPLDIPPPFVLDSPQQNCGSPHILSPFSSFPFEVLTRSPTLDTWVNSNSQHVLIASVEHDSLSSSACASSRTANSSSSSSLCECVSFSSLRAGDCEDNSPQGLTPVPPLLQLFLQSTALGCSTYRATQCFVFLLRSRGLPHLMPVYHLMAFQAISKSHTEFSTVGV